MKRKVTDKLIHGLVSAGLKHWKLRPADFKFDHNVSARNIARAQGQIYHIIDEIKYVNRTYDKNLYIVAAYKLLYDASQTFHHIRIYSVDELGKTVSTKSHKQISIEEFEDFPNCEDIIEELCLA